GGDLVGERAGRVGRPVVDDDELEARARGLERLELAQELEDGRAQVLGLVVGQDDDGELGHQRQYRMYPTMAAGRVFVYGTLLSGEANHGHLAGARYVGSGRTRAEVELRDLGAYPALIAGGAQAVVGEIYEVDEATLAALDALEDHPAYYRRTEIVLDD